MRGRPSLRSQPDEVAGGHRVGEDQPARLMRHEVRPVVAPRRGDRGGDDLEILGAVDIGQDVERAVRLVGAVFHAGLARRHQRRRALRRIGGDQPFLGRLVIAGADDDKTVGLRLADIDEEAGILVLIDEDVVLAAGAERMAEDARRPVA